MSVVHERSSPSRIASTKNFCLLLAVLLCFPFLLRWTGALDIAGISPQSPEHTRAFLKFCLIPTVFLWVCYAIAFVGIRQQGTTTWWELVGARWDHWQAVIRDLGIAFLTLLVMAVVGNVSNTLLRAGAQGSAAFRATVAQNAVEAVAFLGAAFTAGFVEEFVFRGYIQKQCEALFGSTLLASALQILIFTSGHLYQGSIRLIPVLLIGTVLTVVAVWRRSLAPGMIAHGFGDGLVAFAYFAKRL